MVQEKLIVKNFGPIKDAEIELGKVTVFIGEQASGKSVLAKLVAIVNEPNFLLEKDITNWLKHYRLENFLDKESFILYKSENKFQVLYSLENIEVEFYDSDLYNFFEVLNDSQIDLVNSFKEIQKKPKEVENFILINNTIKTLYELIDQRIYKSKYIPTERILISLISNALFGFSQNRIALPRFLIEFGNRFQLYRGINSLHKFDFLDFTYEFKNDRDIININNSTKISLSESSSGIQSLIPLLVVVESSTSEGSETILVEEPELNLYPTTQKKLVEYLVSKTDKNYLLLTTHSPYILSSLDNLIQAGNVIKKHPELKDEVEKIIPAKYHLNYEDVKVYFVADGTARLIMNEELQSIDVSELDVVSESLDSEFEKLLDLKYQD